MTIISTTLDALVKGTQTKVTGLDAGVGDGQGSGKAYQDTGLDAKIQGTLTKATSLEALLTQGVKLPRGHLALDYTGQAGAFAVGKYLLGGTSGDLATISYVADAGATGTIYVENASGPFTAGETLYQGLETAELVTNGTMEADANWTDYGSPSSNIRSSSRAHSGTYSRRLYSVNDYTIEGIKSDTFTTVTGNLYPVTIWVNPDTTYSVLVSITSGDGFTETQFLQENLTRDVWQAINFNYVETGGGSNARINLLSPYDNTSNAYWYFDDVSIYGVSQDGSNYATMDGASQSQTPHLDAYIKAVRPVTTGLDGIAIAALKLEAVLPDLRIEFDFGKYISVDGKLPALTLESRFGMIADAKLPALELEAAIIATETIALDAKLPVLTVESRFGLRGAGDLKLPALELEAEISGGRIFTVEKALPPLEIEASISTPGVFTIDQSLPALEIESSISRAQSVSLDATLPALRIEASLGTYVFDVEAVLPPLKIEALLSREGSFALDAKLPVLEIEAEMSGAYGFDVSANLPALKIEADIYSGQEMQFSVDARLPALTLESTGTVGTFVSLEATLPAIIMGAVGTGTQDGSGFRLTRTGRFDDYILRHSR